MKEKPVKREKIKGIKNLLKLKPYIREVKGQLIAMLSLDVVVLGLSVVTPLLLAQVLVWFTDFDFYKIAIFMGLLCGANLIMMIVDIFSSSLTHRWVRRMSCNLQNDIAFRFLNIKSEKLDTLNSGKITARFSNDCNKLSFSVNRIFNCLLRSLTSIIYVGIAFFVNYIIAIYLLITALVVFLSNNYIENLRAQLNYEKDQKFDEIIGLNNEMVRGWRDIKGLGCKGGLLNNMRDLNENYREFAVKGNDKILRKSLVISTIKILLNAGFYILCAVLMANSWLTLAGFLILYMYSGKIETALTVFAELKEEVAVSEVCAKRIFELYDEKEYTTEKFGTQKLESIGEIKLRNVTFGYEPNKQVLENISFDIKPNTFVAFVGESGIGKSTVLGIISKNYAPQSGEVFIDNVNINDLDEESLTRNISYVQQVPYIFNKSIRENLKLAKQDATDEEIEKVCEQAQMTHFIESLPQKYDTVIGENGIVLSGGQRQRLAIARALLRNSKILLFDEATSALDNISQQEIKKVLFGLKKDHTIVMVAHRLSTIIDADNIILLKNHKIVAQGKHKDLIKNNSDYRQLYGENNE